MDFLLFLVEMTLIHLIRGGTYCLASLCISENKSQADLSHVCGITDDITVAKATVSF